MYVRVNMAAGDPARLAETTRFLEAEARPLVDVQPGSRGIGVLSNAELGLCLVASYWDSEDAMTASEQVVQVSRKELAERLRGTVTVEHYEVPIFVRRRVPSPGAGMRITRIEVNPASLDTLIEEFRRTGVPALLNMPGLCGTQLMADRLTGRCIVATAWEDMAALAANRSAVSTLRTNFADLTHAMIRSVEEYRLEFTSVRVGDTRSLIERDIETWNARDHESWLAGADLHKLELRAPGGVQLSGQEAAEALWAAWNEAFPDNRLEIIAIHADDRGGVHEGRFIGTHTGTLRGPAGEIPPTGRVLDAPFAVVYGFEESKITSVHLYFDQAELLSQLGVM